MLGHFAAFSVYSAAIVDVEHRMLTCKSSSRDRSLKLGEHLSYVKALLFMFFFFEGTLLSLSSALIEQLAACGLRTSECSLKVQSTTPKQRCRVPGISRMAGPD